MKNNYLKCISAGEKIVLDPIESKELIITARDKFDFVFVSASYGFNVPDKPTEKTEVEVLEIIKNGTLRDIFKSFGKNINRLCLTQSQIKQFSEKYVEWFLDNKGTFFLLKGKNQIFILYVRRNFGMMYIDMCDYGIVNRVLKAKDKRCFIVPKL
ncbi:MAG: hypothetical protein ABIF22_00350 [bacterium]